MALRNLVLTTFMAGIPYLFSINGDFVFDDSEAILKNHDVTSDLWLNAFYHDFWGTKISSHISHKSYRPLTILTFKLNYVFNNKEFSAVQFKITNTILHVVCCGVLLLTYKAILRRMKFKYCLINVELMSALLFGMHPVHVEAVAGIVGRADVLAAIAFLTSFLMYDRAMNHTYFSQCYLFLSILLAAIAMLCKENGITVLGVCLVYEGLVGITFSKYSNNKTALHKQYKNSLTRVLSIVASIVFLLYLRWRVMGGEKPEFKATDNPAAFASNVFTRVASHNYIYFINCLLLFWPQWLCYDWSMGCIPLIRHCLDYRILWVILLYLGAFVTAFYMWKSKTAHSIRIITLALAFLIIPFLPASNVFYPVGFVIAERILYIPSVGYCLLITVGLHKILAKIKSVSMKKITISLFYFVILIYGLRSAQRSLDWQTEYKLFTSGLSVCPLNAKVHYNVAKVADAKNNLTWALSEYKEAIRLNPDYFQAMNNYANLLKNEKQFKEAEIYLRKAISLKQDFPAAWMNLGIVLASTRNYVESQKAYFNALKYRKNYPDCYYNLGNLYLELNQTDKARENWLLAIKLNPKHNSAWTNLLAMLDNLGELEKALEIIPNALNTLPDSPSVIFAIANIYGKLNDYSEAERHFLKAIELYGDHVKPINYANLGVLYHRWKKYDLAEKMYRKALDLQPSFKSAKANLNSLHRIKNKMK